MTRRRWIHVGMGCAAAVLLGCPGDDLPPPGITSGSGGADSSAGGESSSSGSVDDSTETGEPTPPLGEVCDVWLQDCSVGSKCMPIAALGSIWDAARCSPVSDDPVGVGEACTMANGPTGGHDNCGEDAFCYFYDTFAEQGECVAFCGGEPADPSCPDGTACGFSNDRNVAFCRATCNPLDQDCRQSNAVCRDTNDGVSFACYVDAAGQDGGNLEPCDLINGCQRGFVCTASELVQENPTSMFSCTAYCDISAPNSCPAGLVCSPWYGADAAPEGLEDVGLCLLP